MRAVDVRETRAQRVPDDGRSNRFARADDGGDGDGEREDDERKVELMRRPRRSSRTSSARPSTTRRTRSGTRRP